MLNSPAWRDDPNWQVNVKAMACALFTVPIESRATLFYSTLDSEVEESIISKYPEITCKKGCAYCCHQKIGISQAEAYLIINFVSFWNIKINWDLLMSQKGHEDWSKIPFKSSKCIFLGEDNLCKIYEVRPGACRWYFSLQDPKLCDIEQFPGGSVSVPISSVIDTLVASNVLVDHLDGWGDWALPDVIYSQNLKMGNPLKMGKGE